MPDSMISNSPEEIGSADLFRVKPDGTELTQPTNDPAYDDQAAFSPDSKEWYSSARARVERRTFGAWIS